MVSPMASPMASPMMSPLTSPMASDARAAWLASPKRHWDNGGGSPAPVPRRKWRSVPCRPASPCSRRRWSRRRRCTRPRSYPIWRGTRRSPPPTRFGSRRSRPGGGRRSERTRACWSSWRWRRRSGSCSRTGETEGATTRPSAGRRTPLRPTATSEGRRALTTDPSSTSWRIPPRRRPSFYRHDSTKLGPMPVVNSAQVKRRIRVNRRPRTTSEGRRAPTTSQRAPPRRRP
mmetsp:Transcript_37363/g.79691  ORF Transcript_37363/g.79691 Transcript_37363/m.79691 type:complete len:231 (-) Transcript_37363:665-1357(-)